MSDSEKDRETGGTSRRRFLGGTVATALGVGVASAGTGVGIDSVMAQDGTDIDEEPLGWTPVNVEEVRRNARDAYYAGMHCGEGTANALIEAQRANGNDKWKDIPSFFAYWGAAGGGGNGALCGTIIGSSSVGALAFGRGGTAQKIANEIHQRYSQGKFPKYQPPADDDKGMTEELPTSRSKSPLCHASVTKWCKVAEKSVSSPERAERCARLAADMAGIAAELLNAEAQGNWEEVKEEVPYPDSIDSDDGCVACHSPANDFEHGGYVNSKMACNECHGPAPHLPESLQKGGL